MPLPMREVIIRRYQAVFLNYFGIVAEVIDQATKIPAGAAVFLGWSLSAPAQTVLGERGTVMWFYNRDFEEIETLTCLETGVQVVRDEKRL